MLIPKRRGQGGDLGDDALAVGHGHAQLDQRLLGREADGQVATGRPRVGSAASSSASRSPSATMLRTR